MTGQWSWTKYENERTVKTPARWRAGRGLTKGVNMKAEGRSGWGRKGSESENKSKTNL